MLTVEVDMSVVLPRTKIYALYPIVYKFPLTLAFVFDTQPR